MHGQHRRLRPSAPRRRGRSPWTRRATRSPARREPAPAPGAESRRPRDSANATRAQRCDHGADCARFGGGHRGALRGPAPRSVQRDRPRPARVPSPAGISARASAPSSEVRMCEPCAPLGWRARSSPRRGQAHADRLSRPRVARDVRRRGPLRRGAARGGGRPAARQRGRHEQREGHHRGHRVAGQSEHERVALRGDPEPGRLARAAAPRSRTPRATPSASSAGLTWSWGPTETPPEMITTSDCASAAPMPSVGRGAVVGKPARRRGDGAGRWASAVSIGALELWISPGPSGSPGARSSSPVQSTATRGRRAATVRRRRRPRPPRRARPVPARVPAASTTRAGAHVLASAADVLAGGDRGCVSIVAAVGSSRSPGGSPRSRRRARRRRWRSGSPRRRRAPRSAASRPATRRRSPGSARRRRRARRSRPSPSTGTVGRRPPAATILGEHPAQSVVERHRARSPSGATASRTRPRASWMEMSGAGHGLWLAEADFQHIAVTRRRRPGCVIQDGRWRPCPPVGGGRGRSPTPRSTRCCRGQRSWPRGGCWRCSSTPRCRTRRAILATELTRDGPRVCDAVRARDRQRRRSAPARARRRAGAARRARGGDGGGRLARRRLRGRRRPPGRHLERRAR